MAHSVDKPFARWCTRGGGYISILLVAVGVVVVLMLAAGGVKLTKLVAGLVGIGDDLEALRLGLGLVCVLLALLLLEAPIYRYVTVGQAKRIQLIKSYFSTSVIARYLDQFWTGREGVDDLVAEWKAPNRTMTARVLCEKLNTKFDDILREDFGLKMYIFPAVVLTATAAIVLFFGFYGGLALALDPTGDAKDVFPPLGIRVDLVSLAAIFGAYTWITSDAITRNYQSALHPSDLYWYALRLVVAVPLGEAISRIVIKDTTAVSSENSGAFLAFVISMFSFERISQILSAAATKAIGSPTGTPSERDDLVIKLPGVDEATANRLTAEGITTIAQMGAADPIRASIRASIPFDFALGLIDAALLWSYVGSKLDILRNYGFKGVSSVLSYIDHDISQGGSVLRNASQAYLDGRQMVSAAQETVENARKAFLDALTKKDNAANAKIQADQASAAAAAAARANPADANYAALQAAAQAAAKDLADKDVAAKVAEADLAAAAKLLDDAKAALATAESDLDKLGASLLEARAALGGKVVSDAAEAAKIAESGLRNVFEEIARSEYAAFIRRMMWEGQKR